MWPFAKLRNGFGSHRYVYSPISFDSQDLNHNLSTRTSAPGCRCCQSCYYSTTGNWPLAMEWRCSSSCHARAAGAAAKDTCGDRVSSDGEWRCRLASWFPLRDQLLVTMVAGLQPRVMENAEGSRVPAARDAGRAPCL